MCRYGAITTNGYFLRYLRTILFHCFFSQNCLETPWIFQPALLEHGAVKHKIMHFRSHGAVNDTIFVNALSLEGTPTNQCGPLTPYHHPPWDLGSIAELSQTPSQQILFKSQHVNIFSKVGNPGSCPVSSSSPPPHPHLLPMPDYPSPVTCRPGVSCACAAGGWGDCACNGLTWGAGCRHRHKKRAAAATSN